LQVALGGLQLNTEEITARHSATTITSLPAVNAR
jgi:hypothetical protein